MSIELPYGLISEEFKGEKLLILHTWRLQPLKELDALAQHPDIPTCSGFAEERPKHISLVVAAKQKDDEMVLDFYGVVRPFKSIC